MIETYHGSATGGVHELGLYKEPYYLFEIWSYNNRYPRIQDTHTHDAYAIPRNWFFAS